MGIKKAGFVFLFSFVATFLIAQTYPNRYWIQFTDKDNSPFSVTSPLQFLSQESVDRRIKYNIPVLENDLPVNPQYIDSVLTLPVSLFHTSRWLNAITIETTDTNAVAVISGWSFVANVRSVKKSTKVNQKKNVEKSLFIPYNDQRIDAESDTWYGKAFNQLAMLNGDKLHAMGYDGRGIKIAVLDAGFPNVQQLEVFNEAFSDGRIKGGYDFSDSEPDVFNDSHIHGTLVLSTMAAFLPGSYIGTAPGAAYWLFVTENAEDEFIIEEDNWIAAAEYADSIGVDIINTSLSYTRFDDPSTDHTFSEMDGNTAHISIAADIAASKGILCVTSAGNSGFDTTWNRIGAPADADSTLTVGAVESHGYYAPFTSRGYSADGDVKPNVMAQGWGAWIVWSDGTIVPGSGTSFSAPIISGMAARLWQAFPGKTNMEIKNAIEQSASQYATPDSLMGYGIPDFYKAWQILGGSDPDFGETVYFDCFPNPFSNEIFFDIRTVAEEDITLELYDISGKIIFEKSVYLTPMTTNRIRLDDETAILPTGVYAVLLRGNGWKAVEKIYKW